MQKVGVPLWVSGSTGAYVIPGFSTHEELALFKEAGLSNFEILKAATYNAAKCLHEEQKWGSVEVGKQADPLILNKNKLYDIAYVRLIDKMILQGDLVDRNALDAILANLKSKSTRQRIY